MHDSGKKWTLRCFAKRQNLDHFFISLTANVDDDFQSLFQKAWAAPRGERERARKSGIGEDLDADDHQWMIGIIK